MVDPNKYAKNRLKERIESENKKIDMRIAELKERIKFQEYKKKTNEEFLADIKNK